MIPISLSLRNFMCYTDPAPLSFESIHTACISGNNGNGKSAIIDAITWALWGQARAGSDDELIHTGRSDMAVEFDFALGQQRYRIIRKRSKPKTQKSAGQTLLEMQLATPDGYKALTGDTVSQTQQKIIQLLHMDYDTFINSAFIRQGHADEFTKKRPGERKQVLGNILQLSVYDELESLARDKTREQENLTAQLEMVINTLQEEIKQKDQHQADFENTLSRLAALEKQTVEQETLLAGLRKEKQALEHKKTRMQELTGIIQQTQRNLNLWNDQALQCRNRIKNFETLIARKSEIQAGYLHLGETRKKSQEMEQKLKQFNSLTQVKHRLEMAVIKAGEELNRQHAIAENRIRDLDQITARLPLCQEEMKTITARLKSLEEIENRLQEERENSKTVRDRVNFLRMEIARFKDETVQIEEKLKLLSHGESASCPLCESELGAEGQKRIEARYLAEKNQKAEAARAAAAELIQKETEQKKLDAEIHNNELKIKTEKEKAQSRCGSLEKALADGKEAAEKIAAEKINLEEIEQRLVKRDFAIDEQSHLYSLEKQIAEIGYDSSLHESLHTEISRSEQWETVWRKLEEAETSISRDKETEARALAMTEELKARLDADNIAGRQLATEMENYGKVEADLNRAEAEYQTLMTEQKRVQGVLGGIKSRLERMAELEIKLKEKSGQKNEARKQADIYKELSKTFGKNGIQADLIDMAIPEIEAEANRLLSRMTDNRMNIKMETQRETRKGTVMETLDINISDELGTRNYEMFSGGEAFRIDFAIRIALSKLLARRAGAPLPTLIIDEGFGTQDSAGIEKIKEAITSIQDDFEKILVITHISDFKDAFPVRIEVTKTPDGSTLYLN